MLAVHSWHRLCPLGINTSDRANPVHPSLPLTQSPGPYIWCLADISSLGGLVLLFLAQGFLISHKNCQQLISFLEVLTISYRNHSPSTNAAFHILHVLKQRSCQPLRIPSHPQAKNRRGHTGSLLSFDINLETSGPEGVV